VKGGKRADIGEFARRAAEQFREYQQGIQGRFDLDLSGPTVEEFVKAVYYTSVIPDEGRYPTICLMTYRRDSGREFHFPFRDPLPPTASTIAKLAHAVAPGSHLCVLSDQGRLLLGGIHVTTLDPLRQFGFSSFRVANPLKLLIRGPGHIDVSTGGSGALVYTAGDIFEERLLQSADAMHALAAFVAAELAGQTPGNIEALEDIFNDLAKAVVRLGHGGLLLVTRSPDMGQFSSSRRIDCPLLQQLLIRYWKDVSTLLANSGGLDRLLAEENRQGASPHALRVASDTTMLENCLSSIGHLAGMDGAIVMDYACNVVAFNAIIARDAEGTDQARLVDHIGREIPAAEIGRNRGSRHPSAMSYARRVPHSFAFVISQDGSVSAFHNRGDGTVLCERDLRVLD
jgi:hypothetical protein